MNAAKLLGKRSEDRPKKRPFRLFTFSSLKANSSMSIPIRASKFSLTYLKARARYLYNSSGSLKLRRT